MEILALKAFQFRIDTFLYKILEKPH